MIGSMGIGCSVFREPTLNHGQAVLESVAVLKWGDTGFRPDRTKEVDEHLKREAS